MVTMLGGGRGQVVIKGKGVTLDWEQLVRKAAERNGQQFADAVVDTMRDWALAIIKREPLPEVSPTALPVRLEDIQAGLDERFAQLAELAERQAAAQAAQAEELARVGRYARRYTRRR